MKTLTNINTKYETEKKPTFKSIILKMISDIIKTMQYKAKIFLFKQIKFLSFIIDT